MPPNAFYECLTSVTIVEFLCKSEHDIEMALVSFECVYEFINTLYTDNLIIIKDWESKSSLV